MDHTNVTYTCKVIPKQNNKMQITNDDETTVSELSTGGQTTNESKKSDDIDHEQQLRVHLGNRTMDELKLLCLNNNISGVSRLTKPAIINAIATEYVQINTSIRKKSLIELRVIGKSLPVKGTYSMTKTALVSAIATHNITTLEKFIGGNVSTTSVQQTVVKSVDGNPSLILPCEELCSSRVKSPEPVVKTPEPVVKTPEPVVKTPEPVVKTPEPVVKTPEPVVKSPEPVVKSPEPIIQIPESTLVTVIEEPVDTKNDPEPKIKKVKLKIPKGVRDHVWTTHIGHHMTQHRCICCKKTIIEITNFEVGHVISEHDGGTMEINNLRPICAVCNHSMGTTNMLDYIKKYGYYM